MPRRPKPKKLSLPPLPPDRWYSGPVLAIDPSSTAVGMAFILDSKVEDCCRLASKYPVFRNRIEALGDGIVRMAEKARPEVIVMEAVESSSFAGRSVKVVIALAKCQGYYLGRLRQAGFRVETVAAETWTRGLGPKPARAVLFADQHPRYQDLYWVDSEFDIADAIGVGFHWIARHSD